MIIRARTVVTMDGPPIDNGAVLLNDGKIVEVGGFNEIKARAGDEIVDLGEQALLPGLINAHCHLDYTCMRGRIPAPESFTAWIQAIIAAKEKLSAQDYVASINDGFAEAKKFGTTTIANFTAFPELISQVQPPIRTWWFAELIDVRSPQKANEIVDTTLKSLDATPHWGLAPHAPFTASENLYRRCDEIARAKNVLLATHLGESRDEEKMFRESRGSLFDFMTAIGRDNSDLHSVSSVEHIAEFCNLDDRWLLIHVNQATMDDMEVLLRASTQPNIVLCPRSHEYFGHSLIKYGIFRTLAFNICLGTDSLASNADLSLFGEMREFQRLKPTFSPREIFELVTTNPARALRQQDQLGRIAPGLKADLIAIPCSGTKTVFDEVVGFEGTIEWMMLEGQRA